MVGGLKWGSASRLIVTIGVASVILLTLFAFLERKRERVLEAQAQLASIVAAAELQVSTVSLRLLTIASIIERENRFGPALFDDIYIRTAQSTDQRSERAIAFMPEVTPETREAFDRSVADLAGEYRALNYPEFRIFPRDDTDPLLPAAMVAPETSRSGVFGFNIGSDPARTEAALRAFDTGLPQITPPIALSQDADDTPISLLLVVPVMLREPWAGSERAILAAGLTPGQIFADAEQSNGPFSFAITLGEPDTGLRLRVKEAQGNLGILPRVTLLEGMALPGITLPGMSIPLSADAQLTVLWADLYFVLVPPLLLSAVLLTILVLLKRTEAQRDAYARDLDTQTRALKESERSAARLLRVQSLGRLVGGVAHDFNNTLSVIMGNLELMVSAPDFPRGQREFADEAIAATQRGAALTRQLLAYGRRAHLQPEDVDVTAVLTDTVAVLSRLLPETIRVTLDQPADLWPARVDQAGLENALMNVALNAKAAMPQGGVLSIDVANLHLAEQTAIPPLGDELPPGRYVIVTLKDTGEGMSEEVFNRAFEPFFSTRGPTEGTGLGLSSIHGFMLQSGGAVRMCSTEGEGTTLRLYLPAAEDGAPKAAKAPGPAAPVACHVLLIEDEDALRSVLTTHLIRAGMEVTACETGDAAAALIEDGLRVDMVVTDLVMPGRLQGLDVAAQVAQRDPATQIILISGYPQQAGDVAPDLVERYTILTKPFGAADLLAAIREKINA